jgi:hypothetical protein
VNILSPMDSSTGTPTSVLRLVPFSTPAANLTTAAPVDIAFNNTATPLGDVVTPPTTTFARASVLGILLQSDPTTNEIMLNAIEGLAVNDVVQTSNALDVSGLVANTAYKIKTIEGYAMTLVPGGTADVDVATTNAVDLTYVPPVGHPGSSLTTFTKAAVGSLGTNATTLSWNVTLNLTVVDDRAVPTVDLTPMDGGCFFLFGLVVDFFWVVFVGFWLCFVVEWRCAKVGWWPKNWKKKH